MKNTTHSFHIGKGIMSILKSNKTVQSASSIVVITDKNVAMHWQVPLKKTITIIIEPGEENKTIQTLEHIWKRMLEAGVDRSSVVVTLGGGVVCDIGGLAAGTFMRGIPVIHIPTTLLAQVDASVGGKTAIDFCGIKNSIGIFHPSATTIIDVLTLKTLPHKQIVSGFAEIIKHAVIADRALFDVLLKIKIGGISDKEWIGIITQSIHIKKKIVEQDETEKNGIRKRLNFGHTVGHAIEALSIEAKNPLLHGEAIALGMVAETRMSRLAGHISEEDEKMINSLLLKSGLPVSIANISNEKIIKLMRSDKKNRGGKILWSLPFRIGNVKSDCILNPDIINKGILSIIKK
ncbi:MAG: 3-dehydroquinate synthase [bacterium]